MTVRGRSALLMVLVHALPVWAQAQTLQGIEPAGAGLPLYRPGGSVAVLAVATPRWVPVPTDPHDLLGDFAYLPPNATDETEGQLFGVLEVEGGRDVADHQGRFVAVPWTVGCGCAEEGWDQPVWVEPGDTVAFLLIPTRKRVPWRGPPVFDVLGWHQPYPSGDFIPYWRPGPQEPKDWLDPMEFYGLLKALPFETAFRLDPGASLLEIRRWLKENPGNERVFPVQSMLRRLASTDPEGG